MIEQKIKKANVFKKTLEQSYKKLGMTPPKIELRKENENVFVIIGDNIIVLIEFLNEDILYGGAKIEYDQELSLINIIYGIITLDIKEKIESFIKELQYNLKDKELEEILSVKGDLYESRC